MSIATNNRKKIAQMDSRKGRKPQQIETREYPATTLGRTDEEDLVLYEYGITDPADGEFSPRGFGDFGKEISKADVKRHPDFILSKRLVHPVEAWDGD